MSQLNSIITYVNSVLANNLYADSSLNGIQVGGWDGPVKTIAYAVDAGLSVIEKATEQGATLLFVHHGLFWGAPLAITGAHREKIELLIKHKCTLYASHLPLDGNTEVGNAFELGRYLGLSDLSPYLEYKGSTVGARASNTGLSLTELSNRLAKLPGAKEPLVLPFGKSQINSIALVTGSGAFAISSAAQDGIDLLITGEPKQEAYHLAKESKMNVIFAGHYATETLGVAALARKVAERFDVKVLFIDEPTGI